MPASNKTAIIMQVAMMARTPQEVLRLMNNQMDIAGELLVQAARDEQEHARILQEARLARTRASSTRSRFEAASRTIVWLSARMDELQKVRDGGNQEG